jgi:hypothetical protein
MAELGFLRAFGDALGLIGEKTINRVGTALTDAEADNYTFQRATGDVLGFYNDVLSAWFGLAVGNLVVPLATVPMQIAVGTASATATVPLNLPAGTYTSTDILKVGLPLTPKIPKTNVTVTVAAGSLTVAITGLAAVIAGFYKGLILNPANAPVAEVRLRVV